jgi:glycerophosphoryl diester phosphodiesterase
MASFFDANPVYIADLSYSESVPTGAVDAVRTAVGAGYDAVSITPRLSTDGTLSVDRSGLTLSAILREFPNVHFNVDLQEKRVIGASLCAHAIREADAAARMFVSSPHGSVISTIKRMVPGVATSLSLMKTIWFYALYKGGLHHLKKVLSGDAVVTTEFLGTSFIAHQGFISEVKSRGGRVFIKGARDEEAFMRLFRAGADGFITSDIATAQRALNGMNLRRNQDL